MSASIPAIALQSLPDCCWVCEGERWELILPPDLSTSAPVRCPHCTTPVDLLDAIGARP